MKKEIVFAYLGLILMTIIIGFSFVFVKIALKVASPFDILAHRFSVAAITLLLYYVFIRKRKPQINKSNFLSLSLLSLFYPLLLFSLQTIGLKYTTASEAGILSAIAPVLTLLFAALILKEKNNLGQIISVLVSVGGVIYIMYANGMDTINTINLKGNFFILLSVISMSFYFVLGRRMNKVIDSMDITFFMTVSAAVIFNLIALYLHFKEGDLANYFIAFNSSDFLWSILYLGVLSSFLSSFLTNNALTVIPASQVSIFNNFSPVIAVFAGILFLNESLQIYHIIGGLMVLMGIVGVNILKQKQ